MTSSAAERLRQDGFVGPVRVFSREECREISAYLARPDHPKPADWGKGRAVTDRFFYDIATRPAILELVKARLGEDVILWGASTVERKPGDIHPWHSDMESSAPDGRFCSVWIGIENTSRESALQIITRSHLLGKTVQESRVEQGLQRNEATPEAMLAAARQQEPEAALVQPDMSDGEALAFDGRLWHGSDNTRQAGRRVALLLQYAAPSSPVRIPDFTQLDWPFRMLEEPLPATILVSGSETGSRNRIVPAPERASGPLTTAVHHFDFPLDSPGKEWTILPAFRGSTPGFADLSCHASVLTAGHSPHAPHAHAEEELLIPLRGEVELVIANGPSDPAPRTERIRPGTFVYYPGGQYHTIRNPGPAPVAYAMFKWRATELGTRAPLPMRFAEYGALAAPAGAPAFWPQLLFEGPTAFLTRLHAHFTELAPGGAYEPHADPYDVAIVTLSGTVETLGQTVGPDSVVWYSAGELHGMRNPGTEPARYLVFEFHGARPARTASKSPLVRAGKRLLRPVWRKVKPYLPEGVRNRV